MLTRHEIPFVSKAESSVVAGPFQLVGPFEKHLWDGICYNQGDHDLTLEFEGYDATHGWQSLGKANMNARTSAGIKIALFGSQDQIRVVGTGNSEGWITLVEFLGAVGGKV